MSTRRTTLLMAVLLLLSAGFLAFALRTRALWDAPCRQLSHPQAIHTDALRCRP